MRSFLRPAHVVLIVIVVFILAGISYVDTANWHPYLPANTGKEGEFGFSGLLRGAAIIFFSYVGFDAASTTARETRNPQRDVPLGILSALIISAVTSIPANCDMLQLRCCCSGKGRRNS